MTRTASETLMSAMDRFGEVEPKDCIIIWTDESGNICWSSSTNSQVIRLGMIEFLKQVLIGAMKVEP